MPGKIAYSSFHSLPWGARSYNLGFSITLARSLVFAGKFYGKPYSGFSIESYFPGRHRLPLDNKPANPERRWSIYISQFGLHFFAQLVIRGDGFLEFLSLIKQLLKLGFIENSLVHMALCFGPCFSCRHVSPPFVLLNVQYF